MSISNEHGFALDQKILTDFELGKLKTSTALFFQLFISNRAVGEKKNQKNILDMPVIQT